jgi:transposase-like protein
MTKAEKMFELVDQYYSSGETRKAFCQQHGLKVSTFAYWISRRRARAPQGGFTALTIAPPPAGTEPVELIYPNGIRVRIPDGNPEAVTRLIQLYEPCSR